MQMIILIHILVIKSFKIELQGFLLIRFLMQKLDHYLSN